MSIYKACDIRGDAEEELSPALYRRWGRALGGRLPPGAPFVVGGDVRRSTPEFLAALVTGLSEAGMAVVDLGVAPTPMVYFGGRRVGAGGCAIVTASHNPPRVNGLKWMVGRLPPDEAEVQALGREPASAARPGGSRARRDLAPEYRAWLTSAWSGFAREVQLKIVLDPGNGCWAGRALPCLQEVFPRARLTAIHDRADGAFPDRDPDCARPEHLQGLAKEVARAGADLGIAFDGDGDRAAFVDDQGTALGPEETTWILLQSFGDGLAGQPFVNDVKLSDRVREAAERLGARSVPQRSGHAFIRRMMLERDARFGAEASGHYFYRELEGGDDGLFTACRLIAHGARCGETLSALRRRCPPVFMTPDLRLAAPVEEQEAILDAVRRAFADLPQSSVDGVRVDFPDGWALARRSVTEPKLTFRFEGRDAAALERVVREFCDRTPMGSALWEARVRSTTKI